ncbi:MAG: chalcone isomerase family protein [Desulforhabdus sp.]|jgi:hypothetical protein|nr:chalcone isomerase family protein [Desulforhabdus sp.]
MKMEGKGFLLFWLGIFSAGFLLAAPATGWARELHGVNFADEIKIGADSCQLTGIGVRKKFFVTVYYGGLYLKEPTRDRALVIQSDQPKGVVLHVVYKEVPAEKWIEGWKEGFANNVADPGSDLQKKIDQFLACFNEPVKTGETVQVLYLPDKGTEVTIKGKPRTVIPGHDFMETLWSIWFGPHPASESLMKGMIGG